MTLAELLEILENHKIENNSRETFTFGVFCQAKLCQKWAKSVRKRENQQVCQMVKNIFKIVLLQGISRLASIVPKLASLLVAWGIGHIVLFYADHN